MSVAKLFIPVGIPGCGKSTWAKILGTQWFTISTDLIREKMVGEGELESVSDMSKNKEVFEHFHEYIEYHLEIGDSVFADATNLRDFARAKLLAIAKRQDAEVHVFVFNNLREALGRNTQRDRTVPVDVMIKMLEQYEQALRDIPNEEYASVTFIESLA